MRRYFIEWQINKTQFKNHVKVFNPEDMEIKMMMASRLFYKFIHYNSKEAADAVVNWVQGLYIAYRKDTEEHKIAKYTYEHLKDVLAQCKSIRDKEPESSFGIQAIRDFIEEEDISYLEENVIHNLDTINNWLKKAYVHKQAIEFVYNCIEVLKEKTTLNTTIINRLSKMEVRLQEIKEKGLKSSHKFLF